jgi:multicomponent Na+:H+ antiporter subunit F
MALMVLWTIRFLVVSIVVSMVRVVIGPTVADRMIGLNLVAAQTLALLVLISVSMQRTILLDVALVYDIFGFLGILVMTKYFSGKKDLQ